MKNAIIEIKGGLGNQFFQIGFGLLATNFNINHLWLNVNQYKNDSKHGGFLLDILLPNITQNITLSNKFDFDTVHINIDDAPSLYNQQLIEIYGNIFYSGYFQNWKYTVKYLPFLRNIINSYKMMNGFYELISNSNFFREQKNNIRIGIHCRRGDYKQKDINAIHGIVNFDDQITAALKLIQKHFKSGPKPEIWLFSDDPIENANGINVFNSYHNNKITNDLCSFFSMSTLDYLICSNSTFGYWAGLLGDNTNVLLPSKWMKNNKIITEQLIGNNMEIFQCDLL